MIARLLLKLPWFLSAPALVLMAAVMAVGLHLVASTYFERTFRDDADPLAGLALAATAAPPPATPTAAVSNPAGAAATATPAAGIVASTSTPAATAAMPAASEPATATPGSAAASAPAPVTTSTPIPTPTPVPAPAPGVLAEGDFRDGDPGHNGKGRARLIRGADGALTLRFEDFSVTNGPDLYVVLTTDADGGRDAARASDALNLGRLRATNGNINYPVPAETDTSRFKSVVVYCRAFHVVFAIATFE